MMERLLPDDLASYESYMKERHRDCSTFDDGPDQPRLLRALAHLKKIQC